MSIHHLKYLVLAALFVLQVGCESFENLPRQQDLDSWEYFNISNGLPSDTVNCLMADHNNYLWVGTGSGLARFDGENWITFTTEDGLADNYITSISEYGTQTWIGTYSGISVFENGKFTNFLLFDSIWVTRIMPAYNGDIWVGTHYAGLVQLTGGSSFEQYFDTTDLRKNTINDIDQRTDGTVWAGTNAGLYAIEGNNEDFYTSANGLLSDTVTAVFCDGFGDTWIGDYYSQYILRLDVEVRSISLYNGGLIAAVNAIAQDPRGNIWIGTIGDGVSRYDGVRMRSYGVSDGLPGITITDIEVDSDGSIWFATFANGIAKYTPAL